MTTLNGFSKADMYKELEYTMSRKSYEKACCQMAELACSRNELNGYLSFLCDYYSKYCLNGNSWVPRTLEVGVREILSMPKRKLTHYEPFQRKLCELTVMLSVIPTKMHSHLYNPKYAGYLNIVEPLLYQETSHKYRKIIDDVFGNVLTGEMRKMFSLLYYLVRNNNRKEMLVLLNYLCLPGQEGIVQPPMVMPDDLKHALRGDIVWALWNLVFEFAVEDRVAEYLKSLWFVFCYNYTSRTRATRINVLFMAFMAVLRPDNTSHRTVADPIINIACAKIRVAFGDVLKLDFEREDRVSAQKVVAAEKMQAEREARKEKKKLKKEAEKQQEEEAQRNPYKYEYLKFYTYFPGEDDA